MSARTHTSNHDSPSPEHLRDKPNILGELSLAIVLVGMAVFATIGIIVMEPIGDEPPGPRLFPALVTILLFGTGIGIAIKVTHAHSRSKTDATDEDEDLDAATELILKSDWRTLGAVIVIFIVFLALLQPVGWLISAAGLYYAITLALGSKAYVRDLVVAFIFSAILQIAFSIGLGLNLPAGVIGVIF
ncbi:tripartite tricarboxylate transporter TctB family protein [Rothia sp. AR01]|uniref:Tripartite tricarboxylate transporter TctB family protein n=1 Tax=Rothia santali TaxID=2949643 RepID=A0A9X2HBP1_9MICC|nr:tripartite tricarboxylate transporter TctB family protein [Rothia santali]MCP3426366.1 tripartite tricarboxylate transporter TctB family protein [Rothia santali]